MQWIYFLDRDWTWAKFDDKPPEEIRNTMKERWEARWGRKKEAWYIQKEVSPVEMTEVLGQPLGVVEGRAPTSTWRYCMEIVQLGLPMIEVPVSEIVPPVVTPKSISVGNGNGHLIEKLRVMADRMQKEIDDKNRPMTQNPTPKRMRELASRRHDGANLMRGQAAMRAMADALEMGTLPDILKDVAKGTKGNILSLVHTLWRSDGYYEGGDSGEYADTSPEGQALQALINGTGPSKEALELERLEQKAKLMVGQVPGFYPTPRAIVERLIESAYLYPDGLTVIEPSAGSGAIADVIRELHPGCKLDVCEWNSTLCNLLEKKGHSVVGQDCMVLDGVWDRVLMNPPFENKQDLKHVKRLYENNLVQGGALVSVMAYSGHDDIAECFEWMEKRFSGWLDDKDWDALLFPRDAFKESGTGVATCGLILRKREE